MEQKQEMYDKLMAKKAADIAKYGGEDKLPNFLRAEYDRIEDSLGF